MNATVPVVVVGAGPTGVTAALLLASAGVECLLLDRSDAVHPQPRAVHLDDEAVRILARVGLAEEFARISRPTRGLRLLDASGAVLAEFPRTSAIGRSGYPPANLFDQPELEALLRARLVDTAAVTLWTGVEVVGLVEEDSGPMRIDLVDRATGRPSSVTAEYVLGCDGAHSGVRAVIGARMRSLGFSQRWLVVDACSDVDLGAWDGVQQLCDRHRPATYLRVGRSRYRFEFRLHDAERAADFADRAALLPLLRPWVDDASASSVQLLRVAAYTFRAAVADRWQRGGVFLLGDAAHLLPPFTGQGLGAGLRDAANLAWKLAAVHRGALPASALRSYQEEREPHVRGLIRLAKIVGRAMSAGGRLGDLFRSTAVPRLHLLPGLRARVADSTTPALRHSALVARSILPPRLAGTLCPNVLLPSGERFDEHVRGRFALVTSQHPDAATADAVRTRGAAVVVAPPGGELARWLGRRGARAAVVRPDGTVAQAGRRFARLIAALPDGALHVRSSVESPADDDRSAAASSPRRCG